MSNKIPQIGTNEFNECPKQETLEEASKRAIKSGLFKDETLFIAGAKWQQGQLCNSEANRTLTKNN